MTIGIEQFRDQRELGLDRTLLQPFRDGDGHYPLGRRARRMTLRIALPPLEAAAT